MSKFKIIDKVNVKAIEKLLLKTIPDIVIIIENIDQNTI